MPQPQTDGPQDDPTVYLVLKWDCDGGTHVERAYCSRDEAEEFVRSYNAATYGGLEVEELVLGPPDVEYDGPVWVGTWTTRRKLKGERQLVFVSESGFVTVVPSAVSAGAGSYRYVEHFTGPGWRDLVEPVELEEPPVWIDSFRYRQEWHTGDDPTPAARVNETHLVERQIEVRGSSREAVEELLRATALEMKARLAA